MEKETHILPQDIVKPITQKWFGPGHLISDPEQSYQRLLAEWNTCLPRAKRGVTVLGNGFCQFHLSDIENIYQLRALHRFFLSSVQPVSDVEGFRREVEALCVQYPAHAAWFQDYLAEFDRSGRFMISHSPEYREAYHPSYRVIKQQFLRYLPLCEQLERQTNGNAANSFISAKEEQRSNT